MPSKKTEPNTHHHNKVWKHTKRDPAVIKKGLRFALKVSYYTQLKSSRVSCYKTSQDPAFKTDFGYLGLYSSEHEANTDIKRFRCAVDFENDRPGQCHMDMVQKTTARSVGEGHGAKNRCR